MKTKAKRSGTKVKITREKKGIKKIARRIEATLGRVGRAQAPENLLNLIRRRCLLIKSVVNVLNQCNAKMGNGSILLQDQEEGKTYWLYQAPEEHFKIFVNKKFIPTIVGSGISVDPPQDQHADIVFLEPLPGHMISIDCSRAWKGEKAGSKKAA